MTRRGRLGRLTALCAAAIAGALGGNPTGFALAGPPRANDPRLRVELFLEHPDIATPTGIDVAPDGRVFVLESNTHFPPQNYTRHPTDRLLVVSDEDRDGRGDKPKVFADGFTHAMSVLVEPAWLHAGIAPQGSPRSRRVYVATRREIVRLDDDDGDLQADRRESLVRLETNGNYPHNGLAGFALDGLGRLHFGFGENLGEAYALIGADGTRLSGGGEGGNVYRCGLDGHRLERIATGFWNPHASCVDAFGNLFTVDNDPDSRPPCRLMHLTCGADFGYRFRNGRKGLHPFTAWNGELPGTLPMTAGTGEAPSGVLAYEHDALPEMYRGVLLATSWGDHRIDMFRLRPAGPSWTAFAEPLVTGDAEFRPVGIALAPDGSLFVSDWVLRDYTLHGKGRVWRISRAGRLVLPEEDDPADGCRPPAAAECAAAAPEEARALLRSPRLDVRRTAARRLTETAAGRAQLRACLADRQAGERERVEAVWAVARIPLETERFEYGKSGGAVFAWKHDAADLAAIELTGKSPQFAWDAAALGDQFEQAPASLTPEFRQRRRLACLTALAAVPLTQPMADPLENEWELLAVTERYIRHLSGASLAEAIQAGADRLQETRQFEARLLALRRLEPKHPLAADLLAAHSPRVVRLALQWIGEERRQDLRAAVEAAFQRPDLTPDLFLAALAALEMLDGVPPAEFDKSPPGKYVLRLVKDRTKPAAVRALALQLVPPDDPGLTSDLLQSLALAGPVALRREAIRSLPGSSAAYAPDWLRTVALDVETPELLRLDAIAGLAEFAPRDAADGRIRKALLLLALEPGSPFQREALRSLRTANALGDADLRKLVDQALSLPAPKRPEFAAQIVRAAGREPAGIPELAGSLPPRPQTTAEWSEALAAGGDAEAGRRLFFHVRGPNCARCHAAHGRGGPVGPDLSVIARTLDRAKLIRSILEPGLEIAPQFATWSIETRGGQIETGMIVFENEGKTILGDAEGKTIELKTEEIVDRLPQKASLMPEKLADLMTVEEFRDLLAFLETLR